MSIFSFSKKLSEVLRRDKWTFSKADSSPMNGIVNSVADFSRVSNGYNANSKSVLPDVTVMDFHFSRNGKTVSAPIELGSYNAYNKTKEPLKIDAMLAFEGSNTFLQSVLNRLLNLQESTVTFSINTPMWEYQHMTLESYDCLQRNEDGNGVLYVSAVFAEIPEVSLTYRAITEAETKSMSSVSSVNTGYKQAQKTNKSLLKELSGWKYAG